MLLGFVGMYLLFITYSRSAFIWALWAFILTFILLLEHWTKKIARKKLFCFILLSITLITITWIKYYDKVHLLLVREWSTSAHFERMMIGVKRFVAHPYWVGLWEAGPASRGVYDINNNSIGTKAIIHLPIINIWVNYLPL